MVYVITLAYFQAFVLVFSGLTGTGDFYENFAEDISKNNVTLSICTNAGSNKPLREDRNLWLLHVVSINIPYV